MDTTLRDRAQDERFEVVRRIGAGAMGVVFHVRDREKGGQEVALKLLKRFDASALYRFKKEFRSLADVVHPNLVTLYELLHVGDRWMFTMELIDGVAFDRHVRDAKDGEVGSYEPTAPVAAPGDTTSDTVAARPTGRPAVRPVRPATPAELDRLQRVLPQLVEGVHAIHARGKLHRDLKPSNVLVDRDGRAVVLDFGVATGLMIADQTMSQGVVGTPAYMAPEQALGHELTAACDWYAVGVMLYEALCGRRPFEGSADSVLASKIEREPSPAGEKARGAPQALCALCDALLARDPAARPGVDEIRRALGTAPRRARTLSRLDPEEAPLLVGRERELTALRDALAAARAGTGSIVHVRGRSGMGKTALVEGFVRELDGEDGVFVLRGRCHEQESVPYKALDSLIDALAAQLATLPEEQVHRLVPPDMWALVRLFPVLRRVDAIAVSALGTTAVEDPVALRMRAFAALRALIDRLCERSTPVLYIDDLQWGDTESAELLADVFPVDAMPPALVILAYRPEEESSAFLRAFGPPRSDAARIAIGRLPLARARELALALLPAGGSRESAFAEAIAREAGGSPFFVQELARYVLAAEDVDRVLDQSWHISLEDALSERIAALPADARRVLELIAVAANPIPQTIALTAADLTARDAALLVQLRGEHLVRTSGPGLDEAVETAHDRIRETIVARLDPAQRRAHHLRLARELEAWGEADPEAIAVHLEAAGERDGVADYLLAAAANAVEGLAFDRAADLRARALELTPPDAPSRQVQLVELGEALGFAGRSTAAAEAYLTAAAIDGEHDAHDLRKQAAEHLLYSGQIDRGVEVLDHVLEDVGVRRPRSRRAVLASLVWLRARLALRGSRYAVGERTVTGEQRKLLEACWSAGIGFSMVDTFRSVEFSARHLLAALDSGDAFHISRGLTAESCLVSLTGGRGLRKGRSISERAVEIAESLGRPDALNWAHSSIAFVDYMAGEWKDARRTVAHGIEMFTQHRTGFAWELNSMRTYELWCLYYLGELDELSARLAAFLRESRERGDLYSVTTLSIGLPTIVWLARDRPEVARSNVEEAMRAWTHRSVHLQHYWANLALGVTDLYEGEPARAIARLDRDWKPFTKAMFLRIQLVRLELLWLRAAAHVLAAERSGSGRELRRAKRDATTLARGEIVGFRHVGAALLAGVAAVRGDERAARERLTEAIAGFDERGMSMHAACARLRLAELTGDDEARRRGLAWAERHDVAAPSRFARTIVPGPFDRLAASGRGETPV